MSKVSLSDKMRIQSGIARPAFRSEGNYGRIPDWRLVLELPVDTSNTHSDDTIQASDYLANCVV